MPACEVTAGAAGRVVSNAPRVSSRYRCAASATATRCSPTGTQSPGDAFSRDTSLEGRKRDRAASTSAMAACATAATGAPAPPTTHTCTVVPIAVESDHSSRVESDGFSWVTPG